MALAGLVSLILIQPASALEGTKEAVLAVPKAEPAAAPKTPMPLNVELNALAQVDKTCRLSIRVRNNLKVAIDDMALELVLFDWDGMTDRFVVVRTGQIPEGRSRVRQYDMPNLDCEMLGSVLLNDISECTGDGLTADFCLDRVAVASRTPATFEY